MQIKRFIKEHNTVCKISLQKKKQKKKLENKLKQCIGKPRNFWKAIKSLGLPNKSGRCIVGALVENQKVKHDTMSILKTFKTFYSNTAENLLARLSKLPNRYTIKFIPDCYKNFHYLKIQIGLNN